MTPVPRRLHKRELAEVVAAMPEIAGLDASRVNGADLLVVVLGFEDRAVSALDALVASGVRVGDVAVIEYGTNREDNTQNWSYMSAQLASLCEKEPTRLLAGPRLAHDLRGLISLGESGRSVVFDLSVASNDVVIEALGALMDCEIDLTLLYTEAAKYRPTEQEFHEERARFIGTGEVGLDDGVLDVTIAGENTGAPSPNLPQSLIIFPGFSRDRVRAIISQLDSDWIVAPEFAPLTWMVGLPPHQDLLWRRQALYEIHDISTDSGDTHDVSTFDYRETLRALDDAYSSPDAEANIAIAALGSKMQAAGIALFCCARSDVSVYLARPRAYNAGSYTQGARCCWQLELGATSELRHDLREVGTLEMIMDTDPA